MRKENIVWISIIMLILISVLVSSEITTITDGKEIFKELKVNDAKGTAIFSVNNPTASDITKESFTITFNEICGHVNSYQILTWQNCTKIRTDCTTENKTNITTCINTTYYEMDYCPITKLTKGIKDYKIVADITDGYCNDGQFNWGHRIDWIPNIVSSESKISVDMPEWAWWNVSSPFTQNNGFTGWASATETISNGMCILTKNNITLYNTTLEASDTSTNCILYLNASGTLTQLSNVTIASSIATFNYNLSNNTKYCISCDKNGASRTTRYSTSGGSFAVNNSAIDWAGEIRGGVPNYNVATSSKRTLLSMTVANLTYVPDTATYEFTWFNQSPSDITSTNIWNLINISYNASLLNGSYPTITSPVYLNYTTISDLQSCIVKLNSSCSRSNGTVYQKNNISNTSNIFNFQLNENDYIPATYNYNGSLMSSISHSSISINGNNVIKMEFYNLTNLTGYNFLELMANATNPSSALPLQIYYCNSSYTTAQIDLSSNCVLANSLSPNQSINHTHSVNSWHKLISIPIINGNISNVRVTSTSYFILYNPSMAENWNIYYITNLSRTSAYQTSSTLGIIYSDFVGSVDSHLHQFGNNTYLKYIGCANISSAIICDSTFKNDAFGIDALPPTAPNIIIPVNGQNVTRYLNITYLASVTYDPSVNISFYNITLLNNDTSYNMTIQSNNSINLSYYWETYSLNLSLGEYFIKVLSKDTLNQTSYSLQLFNLTTNSQLNISAYNNSVSVSNFSVNVTDLNTSVLTTQNTTTGELYYYGIIGHSYKIDLYPPNEYALDTKNITSTSVFQDVVFNTFASNSVNLSVRDEGTNALITESITFVFNKVNSSIEYRVNTSTGLSFIQNLSTGSYTVLVIPGVNSSYSQRSYTITVGDRSYQTLNTFLGVGGNVIFTYMDIDTSEIIEGVSVTMYRIINGTWTVVESHNTDITGKAQFSYTSYVKYQFYSSVANYTDKTFILDPVLFTSYDVKIKKISGNPPDFTDANIYFSPSTYYKNVLNNFTFIISSSTGILQSYGYRHSSPCNTYTWSGTNANGGMSTQSVNVSCAGANDLINLTYWYVNSLGTNRTFYQSYHVIQPYNSYTFLANKDNSYGMGDFEKTMIVSLVAIVICGIGLLVGGAIVSLVLALLIFGYFVAIGFISIYIVIIPIIIGVIYLIGRRE